MITLAIIAVAGYALYPVAAHAAGSLVTIVDSSTNNPAKVVSGKLEVGDGTGNLTVDGTLAARPQVANNPWHFRLQPNAGEQTSLFDAPAGVSRLAITSLSPRDFQTGIVTLVQL